ncbi:MAG TPA: metallophosphoesterase family protein [Chitinophagaceae bacterium]|nr:metallophosphoesterase family protein [Chitinophagaceae bacterium]
MKPLLPARIISFCCCFSLAIFSTLSAQVSIIPYGSSWKYWANSQANFQTNWETVAYNDVAWPSGDGELGYGDGDEVTCIPAASPVAGTICTPTGSKWPTYYFRKLINIPDPSVYSSFTFNVERDDGYVVYVNGVEVGRNNLPAGAVTYGTSATNALEDAVISFTVATSAFSSGNNTIAVEMHQASVSGAPPVSSSSDISFNLELMGNDAFSAVLSRGPYLQSGSQDGITIRWRTTTAENSRVELGTVYGVYPVVVSDATAVTEHVVRVTGLSLDTRYFYRIGTSTALQLPDANQFFTTLPASNTTRRIRIVAFGDCGRGNIPYQDDNLANYRNYLSTNGIDAADAWLLLGDNAYDFGSDADFSTKFFGIYGSNIMENHKLYPSPGNHDYGNSSGNKALRNMAYHTSFTVPQNGESGGVASNKQNYYSFDIGNIHFLSLDSYGTESDGTSIETSGSSALKTWLTADLAANTRKWTIAYWHHPPYTKGSHNSDTEGDLVNIRQNFISFLETRGVDMIVCGHSHNYERGYLIKNYTGNWASFNAGTHALSTSSATYTSGATCPYVYNSTPANHGTVYVVAGSAGASGTMNTGFGTSPMPFAVNDGGLFYFEVEDNRLDAKMLRRNGTVFDQFTIIKDVNQTTDYTITNGNSLTLTASWPGNYNWSTAATTRSINVTPPVNTVTNYSVADEYGCITDQFNITASNTLPVKMLQFDAKRTAAGVELSWTVMVDQDAEQFIIERSANGRDFIRLSTLDVQPAAGEQSFNWLDPQSLPGAAFYRLSIAGNGTAATYFGIKKVAGYSYTGFEVKAVAGVAGKLVIDCYSERDEQFSLTVYSVAGNKIRSEELLLMKGTTRKAYSIPPGYYICELRNSRGEAVQQKMVVQ